MLLLFSSIKAIYNLFSESSMVLPPYTATRLGEEWWKVLVRRKKKRFIDLTQQTD